VCSPTRVSILTGKYPARVKTTEFFCGKRSGKLLPAEYLCRIPLEEVTIAETLKKAGYSTFFAGKWHLGPKGFWPEDQGFDVNRGGIDRGGPYGGKKYFSPYGNPRLEDGPAGEHLPDRLATETVKFIEANKDKPFLAYLSFYSVHTPLMGRADLVEKYKKKSADLKHEGEKWKPERQRQARQYQDHAVYAAMVGAMDQAVGKVLAALDRLKLADNTIVVFFSDNGGLSTSEGSPTSNVPLRAGKGWSYEGGVREPCIIRVPGMTKPGSVCKEPIISTDFFPTILDVAKIPAQPKNHVDGVSLAKLLADPTKQLEREAIYWHYPHYGNQGGAPSGAIRVGDWKLIEWFEDDSIELFNLADDIGESKNLAKIQPERAAKMKKMLADWRKSVDANMPRPKAKKQR
jgi:arylsulfatase A-like enzyme